MAEHVVIFSHGFGVTKTDRGLFTDIVSGLSEVQPVMFDYNDVDEQANTITAKPFSEQIKILGSVVDKTKAENPETKIDIIAHSQGCNAVALLNPAGIRRTVFICPPNSLDNEIIIRRVRDLPGSIINLNGISTLTRTDGSTTLVPAEYWRECTELNPTEGYRQFAKNTELNMIVAKQDEVLGESDFPGFTVLKTEGSHNFKDPKDRSLLIEKIREILL